MCKLENPQRAGLFSFLFRPVLLKCGLAVAGTLRLQERIAVMMQGGASLDRVEAEVINGSDLNPGQKAALLLYALSFVKGTEQRAQDTHYLRTGGR
jgi:hypothetical protein